MKKHNWFTRLLFKTFPGYEPVTRNRFRHVSTHGPVTFSGKNVQVQNILKTELSREIENEFMKNVITYDEGEYSKFDLEGLKKFLSKTDFKVRRPYRAATFPRKVVLCETTNGAFYPPRNFTPDNWPPNAPPYDSSEGWEYEKEMKRKRLITEFSVIPWLSAQADVRARIVAQRLKEIISC